MSNIIKEDSVFKLEPKHTRAIVCGKLYDTEKSNKICKMPNERLLFVTPKGNFFSCDVIRDQYSYADKNGVHTIAETVYCDIRPETIENAKINIGMSNPKKYIELFGEVDEA